MRPGLFLVSLVILAMFGFAPFSEAQDERLQIVASYSILEDVVKQVTGDLADVTGIIPAGADPHSFVPSPGDLTTIADADVIFVNGAFFEEGLMEAIENAGEDINIVPVSSCVPIIAFTNHDHDADDDHADENHADEEHGHDEIQDTSSAIAQRCAAHIAELEAFHTETGEDAHHDEAHTHDEHEHPVETLGRLYAIDCGEGHAHDDDEGDGHNHGMCDPHVWMEPHNVMYWTMQIRDTLVEMDADNAAAYSANAAAYLEALDELNHDFIIPMVETVPQDKRILVTNHESLGYFAHHYGFEIVTTVISGGGTLAEPSAADIANVIDLIQAQDVPAIFAETTIDDRLAQQIADETGTDVYLLYSGSLSSADGPASNYLDYMRHNVTVIVEALGGGR